MWLLSPSRHELQVLRFWPAFLAVVFIGTMVIVITTPNLVPPYVEKFFGGSMIVLGIWFFAAEWRGETSVIMKITLVLVILTFLFVGLIALGLIPSHWPTPGR